MKRQGFVNPFTVLRADKKLKRQKGKEALLRHFEQLRSRRRRT